MMAVKQELQTILHRLLAQASEDRFVGIDPYDLASAKLRLPGSVLSKVSFLNKVSPFNFRPLLGIAPSENSKSNALFLNAMVLDGVGPHLQDIEFLLAWLEKNKSPQFDEFSVGFAFEMALTRYSSGPGKTSLIISLFAVFALMDLYERTNDERALQPVLSFARLLEQSWLKEETAELLWYSYLPDVSDEVYNASAKVGRFFSKLYKLTGNEVYLIKARKILSYLRSVQNPDGTWAYSNKISYVDGFHTAFILEAIHEMKATVGGSDYDPMFASGLSNYCEKLFGGNRPLHFHPEHRPRDVRSHIIRTEIRDAANAIILFTKLKDLERAKRILQWTIANYYDKRKKYFYFYDNPSVMSKIRYVRWQGWMALAIATYLNAANETD